MVLRIKTGGTGRLRVFEYGLAGGMRCLRQTMAGIVVFVSGRSGAHY
ncbi:MAG: hypothetical protein HA496_09990 [Thaumarchaeota archaeon]|jgi:hypothetical protein|nr:hypothetical protein [Nitrososphaerota archaeon]